MLLFMDIWVVILGVSCFFTCFMDCNDGGVFPIMGEASFCPHSVGEIQEVLFGDWGSRFNIALSIWSSSFDFPSTWS